MNNITVVIDRRVGGTTEKDARGKFLAPDTSVLIARVPQIDGGIRSIYAHTRARAVECRDAIRQDRTLIDGLSSDAVAMIIDAA